MPPKRSSSRLASSASASASPAPPQSPRVIRPDSVDESLNTPVRTPILKRRSTRSAVVNQETSTPLRRGSDAEESDPFEFKAEPESPAPRTRSSARKAKGKAPVVEIKAEPTASNSELSDVGALSASSHDLDEPHPKRLRLTKTKGAVKNQDVKGKGKAALKAVESDNELEEDIGPSSSSSKSRPRTTRALPKRASKARAMSKPRIVDNDSDDVENISPRSRKAKGKKRVSAVVDDDDSESDFKGSDVAEESEAEELSEVQLSDASDAEEEAVAAPTPTRRRTNNRGAAAAARRVAKADKAKQAIYDHHPELLTVWEQLETEMEVIVPVRADQPKEVTVTLLPFQQEGLYWMMRQEESRFNGGILADEMGMGKTLETISLLVSKRMRPNLILTPTVAIMQWMTELQERTAPGTFKVLLHHGANRPLKKAELMEYDIVLSTYAIIEQGYRKEHYGFTRKGEKVHEKSLLHSIPWARVVLDEAHAIKDRSCSTARAVFNLQREKQWSLSGTPLQNRVGELYSLIRFMNADPFSYYFCKQCPCKMQTWSFSNRRHCDGCGHISHQHFCWWNAEILKPIQRFGGEGDGLVAFKKLGTLLDRIMLRRTKVERTEELGLPPRVVTVRNDVFNEAEEELYESLYSDSARTFSTYVQAETVLNNYASIFSLLSRMRLAVNHPDLVTTRLALHANTAKEILVCGICGEEAEDAISSKCKHTFCREDARQYIQSSPEDETPTCPVCYKPLSIDLSMPEVFPKTGGDTVKRSIVNYIDMSKWRSSTKIEALVEELTALQKEDSTAKAIVFSQFVSFLDLIQWRLSRAGFNLVKLDGRMTPAVRATVIKQFMTDPAVTVFLVSLKAGGVALNLTEANRVYIMDPWWNPFFSCRAFRIYRATEDQAFDRIHRLGQVRPIKITRMIVSNSIESRILQLQEKKKMLFQSTVGKDMEALAKLSEEDLRFLFVL
ncbi:DNA repair protein rad16 [Geranomyces variabilis]|uniref:DNA repair protein rad16 n=1 Tax=Geranomyces variabilis TaxID=109894 RepID=A0AAD5TKB3_9FUNG|nr:DNA repair protein rad16 [Geranomyces variabilis]